MNHTETAVLSMNLKLNKLLVTIFNPKILVIFMENLKENRQVWSGAAIFISVVIALACEQPMAGNIS